jgi:hypothetical protein
MDRLVQSPVFILTSVRSGSTLLRCLLGAHSQIHAPHELHLGDVRVELSTSYADLAMRTLGLDVQAIEQLLWDRILHLELVKSGKQIIIDKTPSNVLMWPRLAACWPDAKYIFLLRHPAQILASAITARPERSREDLIAMVDGFIDVVQAARTSLPGTTVRYEELTADPASTIQRLCEFLGVAWEPRMLSYGEFNQGPFQPGIGDWGAAIESGRVQPSRPLPKFQEVPHILRVRCQTWDYLP